MPNKVISIKWDFDNIEHVILLHSDGSSGFCKTHGHSVSVNYRCEKFPCQTTMWSDLWRIELNKIGGIY
jgi:hypothetical protein